jgi:hypothetical protein
MALYMSSAMSAQAQMEITMMVLPDRLRRLAVQMRAVIFKPLMYSMGMRALVRNTY